MIYRVAVVDDERADFLHMAKLLQSYGRESGDVFETDFFANGEEFLRKDKAYDAVFIDVCLPGQSGFETAKKMRATNGKSVIVFCTDHVKHAIKGYEVGAAGCLIKPVERTPFFLTMDKVCEQLMGKQSAKLAVKTVHGQVLFAISEIVYVEVQRHNLFFTVMRRSGTETVRTRGSMQEVEDMLRTADFARCSSCYLVNMNFIQSVENNLVKVPSAVLQVSRTFRKSFNECFAAYLDKHNIERIETRFRRIGDNE